MRHRLRATFPIRNPNGIDSLHFGQESYCFLPEQRYAKNVSVYFYLIAEMVFHYRAILGTIQSGPSRRVHNSRGNNGIENAKQIKGAEVH